MSELLQVLNNLNEMILEEETCNTCTSYYADLLEARSSIETSLEICGN